MELKQRKVDVDFWKGKKVFLTGHTGFKGSWLSIWLKSMGSVVKGYSLEPNTSPNLFTEAKVASEMDSEIGDIRNLEKISNSMSQFDPDILIHMAAQPLVRLSYIEPVDTYTTNVIGTVNVLEAARSCKNLKAIVSEPQISVTKIKNGTGVTENTSLWEVMIHTVAVKDVRNL